MHVTWSIVEQTVFTIPTNFKGEKKLLKWKEERKWKMSHICIMIMAFEN